MRKRLIKLTGALLISGASSVALAVPASAVPVGTADATAIVSKQFVPTGLRLSDTNTTTGTGTALMTIGSSAATLSF